MTDDPHFTAYQREFEPGGHDPGPVFPRGGVVVGVVGGIALAILLVAVVS